jgi:hypothetical protein
MRNPIFHFVTVSVCGPGVILTSARSRRAVARAAMETPIAHRSAMICIAGRGGRITRMDVGVLKGIKKRY